MRFGVNLTSLDGLTTCLRAEELGYDSVLVPDHLGFPAPFSLLAAAAAVTERVRLGTFVLNAGFWNPALLAREVETLQRLSGGRFELGLGTGYNRAEFDAAGLPFGSPGERVTALVELLDQLPADAAPLLLGGHGTRMLRLAARRADTVAFAGASLKPGSVTGELLLRTAAELDERVALVAAAAQGRDPERNLLVQAVVVTDDRAGALAELRTRFGLDYLTDAELAEVPTLLVGTVAEIRGQLDGIRQRYGITYVTVLEPFFDAFAPIVTSFKV